MLTNPTELATYQNYFYLIFISSIYIYYYIYIDELKSFDELVPFAIGVENCLQITD